MKAITYDKYGPLEALALKEIPTPAVKDGDVPVRVRAAGLQIRDVFSVKRAPYMVRVSGSSLPNIVGELCPAVFGSSLR